MVMTVSVTERSLIPLNVLSLLRMCFQVPLTSIFVKKKKNAKEDFKLIQMLVALLDCFSVKETASNAMFVAEGSYEVNGWKHLKKGWNSFVSSYLFKCSTDVHS